MTVDVETLTDTDWHPGTELYGEQLVSEDPALRWSIIGQRNASFATDFDYCSD